MVVTVNVPAVPTVNVVLAALVIAGACRYRQREALGGVGAPRCRGDGEGIRPAGARGGRAAEHPGAVALNVTPLGSAPLALSVGRRQAGGRHRERARPCPP